MWRLQIIALFLFSLPPVCPSFKLNEYLWNVWRPIITLHVNRAFITVTLAEDQKLAPHRSCYAGLFSFRVANLARISTDLPSLPEGQKVCFRIRRLGCWSIQDIHVSALP
ncbi:hypothetical protein C8Q78DRAFT_1056642 [Trametes maxima]|nr:hypothetical protein C8Q78DRAFT_1056642 [Trametes maxima]